ncbi:GlxA family transcriptional regulator [Actinophytocola algeriensis]|uniref:Transcriptional regulator GlxA family with amidase domain n=1 Tax=Actinophytocola algeriensis TaxID=1768010 RepID=A0A7W7QAC7_9PSEU|nr:helix-turn-helix domain-containing protein [Actinophytocola algeriensis]MBB4909924.1 transcriptional regulator GlxA family with amidase domain [Actinophytocola algeriensis]MBE1475914.1 transcriptional regulator GlxA family with amidase domain [Actinophytocola algeriensis]
MRVVVPIPGTVALFELAVPVGVFGAVDRHDLAPDWYELVVCGAGAHPASAGLTLSTRTGLSALRTADLVVVPACVMPDCEAPPELLSALRKAHARGARIASLCTGAFVLAAAGLLDGRTVTTHWMYADELRRRYPKVTVDEHPLYVDDGDILTSAGTAAALDLCLHIVRQDFGAAVAAEVGRRMVLAPHREGGQSQYIPAPLPAHADGFAPVLEWAVRHLDRPLTMAELADRAGMSLRTFGRHFADRVGVTPLAWLNQQRLARARELLETTNLPVEVVAQRSGLGTGSGLRQHFQRAYATTPATYRRTFRATAAG